MPVLLSGGQRLPTGDDLHALPRFGVIAHQREVALELDNSGQLATLVPGAADRFGCGLIDGERALQLGRRRKTGKR